jgi:hypothetical protein
VNSDLQLVRVIPSVALFGEGVLEPRSTDSFKAAAEEVNAVDLSWKAVAFFGNAVERPWVIDLDEWLTPRGDRWLSEAQAKQVLVQCVNAVFERRNPREPLPTVFVVEKGVTAVPDYQLFLAGDYQLFLTELIEAGAILLQPEGDAELAVVRDDPLRFAAQQLACSMQAVAVAQTVPVPSTPSKPDAYAEFATAFTRLSAKVMEDVIAGRRSDDWRYEIG